MKTLSLRLSILSCSLLLAASAALAVESSDTKSPAPSTTQAAPKKAPQLVDATEAEKLIADKKVVVIDVRTAEEFAAGHIAGATNLDFRDKDFSAKVGKLDKDQAYLVNCAAGGRSAKACKLMNDLDFKSLYDLKGGMRAWESGGKPTVK